MILIASTDTKNPRLAVQDNSILLNSVCLQDKWRWSEDNMDFLSAEWKDMLFTFKEDKKRD